MKKNQALGQCFNKTKRRTRTNRSSADSDVTMVVTEASTRAVAMLVAEALETRMFQT